MKLNKDNELNITESENSTHHSTIEGCKIEASNWLASSS